MDCSNLRITMTHRYHLIVIFNLQRHATDDFSIIIILFMFYVECSNSPYIVCLHILIIIIIILS